MFQNELNNRIIKYISNTNIWMIFFVRLYRTVSVETSLYILKKFVQNILVELVNKHFKDISLNALVYIS